MTYTEGSIVPDEPFPLNITAHHRSALAKARSYLESIARNHPEWIVHKVRC